jgi:lysophospholipase L1-like esterase
MIKKVIDWIKRGIKMLSTLFIRPTSKKNIKVVCIGDSITAFIQWYLEECNDARNWTVTVNNQLGIQMINAGIGGNTSTMMLTRFQNDVLDRAPDYCIIEQSVNDSYQHIATDITMRNIATMVSLCKQNNIIPMIMCSPPEFDSMLNQSYGVYPEDIDKLPTIRTAEQKLCTEQGIVYIDVYHPFLLTPTSQNLTLYASDKLHQSIKGYDVIAKVVIDTLQPLIGGA